MKFYVSHARVVLKLQRTNHTKYVASLVSYIAAMQSFHYTRSHVSVNSCFKHTNMFTVEHTVNIQSHLGLVIFIVVSKIDCWLTF